jgi:DNA-binding transcriptional MerR regulator
MALKEIHIEKVYFSISEVAELIKVNQSLLRYWETEFTNIQPKKTKKGDRLYTKKDIENIKIIFHLLKEKGFTIEGAKKYLRETKDTPNSYQLSSALNRIKSKLIDLQEKL